MKLYTKTGDSGDTSVIGGRLSKSSIRVDAYGTIDTLNAHLNLVMSLSNEYNEDLIRISNYLFTIGYDLACLDSTKFKTTDEEVLWLESRIDFYQDKLVDFQHFVLPGGTVIASNLHICRTIVRTCERKIVLLNEEADVNKYVLEYINRLSDFIYILACYENFSKKVELITVKM